MVKSTIIARLIDAMPLAASMDEDSVNILADEILFDQVELIR